MMKEWGLRFILFWLGWSATILFFLSFGSEYPMLRARFGTILHHSSDSGGVEHIYCYYPKGQARSEIVIKKVNSLDQCEDWLGMIIFMEADWASEREKYWWSREQHLKDCNDCNDL